MSKVSDLFPAPGGPVEVINEEHFAKFEDAALQLMCFEIIADAAEAIEEGAQLDAHGEVHVGLIEACMALAVMFRRRTGHGVQEVASDHLDQQRRSLLGSGEVVSPAIPIKAWAALKPHAPEAFKKLDNAALVRAGFSYARRFHEHIQANSPELFDLEHARVFSIDAMSALSALAERLSAADPGGQPGLHLVGNAPSSETL
ncbi:hypothetical protein [Pseudomonas putida]|uniref:Uncharacterized protein n=1 Tax=Pseudomonas putida TaxID=303 RepID=A0A1B2F1C5_PSEPU|nr:hypothetical protein [Pseudomonas putida]ANY85963.1 hypothetical protein IEC33019_0359 [Pseudomonas putida]